MTARVRPWQYYDHAVSLCPICFRRVDAKIVFQDEAVWMLKRCPEHGATRVLVADDVDWYRRAREVFIKPAEMPCHFHTKVEHGCPYDCGLCPDHEQHSCLTLIEVGDGCNLECPVCYAESGPSRMSWHGLDVIEAMLDAVVESEGEPDVVQISGGEPTLHPDFFAILDAAKRRPIRHLMLNTNGIRIAREPGFAERLAAYLPGFEVYLQFDSFEEGALRALRGADLREIRRQALERLNELDISTTLVVTVAKGVNDHELGRIVDHALKQPAVRGVTFQPVQAAGRLQGYDAGRNRLTLTEVRRRILEQTAVFKAEDIIPVPCHPDALGMAYALKLGGEVRPLTGLIDPRVLIEGGRNTIVFEGDEGLRKQLFAAFSTAHSPASGFESLKSLLCCLPRLVLPSGLSYRNLFRVILMQFMDAESFDVRSVRKTCVHIVHPEDRRIIPFDTYNLFYRGDLERTRLAPLRAGVNGMDRLRQAEGLA